MFGRARLSAENRSGSGWKFLDWLTATGDYVHLRLRYNFLTFTIRRIILLPLFIPALALYLLFGGIVVLCMPLILIWTWINGGDPKLPWE